MALPDTGEISLDEVGEEFEDTAPHSLNEFYNKDIDIPDSGTISLDDFYGASRFLDGKQIDASLCFGGYQAALGYDHSYQYIPSPAGTKNKFTVSLWAKIPNYGVGYLFWLGASSSGPLSSKSSIGIYTSGQSTANIVGSIRIRTYLNSGSPDEPARANTSDVGNWFHVVLSVDTTQSTASDRLKFWVNNVPITIPTGDQPQQNLSYNYDALWLGSSPAFSTIEFLIGNLAEVHFVDGQALDPTDFGQTRAGQWTVKEYTGTYSGDSFYLDYSVSKDADQSGLGNDLTSQPNSWISKDSPTNNFAGFDVQQRYSSSSFVYQGGLQLMGVTNGGDSNIWSTQYIINGIYYWEVRLDAIPNSNLGFYIGMQNSSSRPNSLWTSSGDEHSIVCVSSINGKTQTVEYGAINKTVSSTDWKDHFGTSLSSGDIVQVAVDTYQGRIWFGLNGTWYNEEAGDDPYTPTTQAEAANVWSYITPKYYEPQNSYYLAKQEYWFPCVYIDGYSSASNPKATINFGNNPSFGGQITAGTNEDYAGNGEFKYIPPYGSKPICSKTAYIDFYSSTLQNGLEVDKHFYIHRYTGTGTASNNTQSGWGFEPCMVIIKKIANGTGLTTNRQWILYNHSAPSNILKFGGGSASTDAASNYITSISSSGSITLTGDANANGEEYVMYLWNGSLEYTSNSGTVSSNVVTDDRDAFTYSPFAASFDGTGSNETLNAGTAQAVEFAMMWKDDSSPFAYHRFAEDFDAAYPAQYLHTGGWITSAGLYGSNDFYFGEIPFGSAISEVGKKSHALAFSNVEGYCRIGTYISQGSDTVFVNCGFKPKLVLFSNFDNSKGWYLFDELMDFDELLRFQSSGRINDVSHGVRWSISSLGFRIRDVSTVNIIAGLNNRIMYVAFGNVPSQYSKGEAYSA